MDSIEIKEKFGEFSQNRGLFSKEALRKSLAENLKELRKLEDAKSRVSKVSIYRDLNEGYFLNKSALHFCQLSYLDAFIQKSNIQQDKMFYAFINAPKKKSGGVIEFTLWKYLLQMYETSIDSIQIMSLPTKGEEFETPKVNQEL